MKKLILIIAILISLSAWSQEEYDYSIQINETLKVIEGLGVGDFDGQSIDNTLHVKGSMTIVSALTGSNIFINGGNPVSIAVNNIAIGDDALGKITNGGNNIAIGTNALDNYTTGSNAISIGHNNNTKGNHQDYIGIGNNILSGHDCNTVGIHNLIIGNNTAEDLDEAYENVIIGSNSFTGVPVGLQAGGNTSVGYSAMTDGAEGIMNCSFGAYSGQNLITGSNNVNIGYRVSPSSDASNEFHCFSTEDDGSENIGFFYGNSVDGYAVIDGDLTVSGQCTVDGLLKLTPSATAPSSPELGWLYSSSADNHLYYYNGLAWVQLD